ncbi:MAG TPA: FCD domain-containing protein [Acidimicrobiales bacterium]|nr:FCD domain-containing protein [Acidimicrobiales bacterium]
MTSPLADSAPIPWRRRPARLGEAVVASVTERIVTGELPPGSPLPAEPVLCQDYGVSRSVIRESLKLLEEKGLLVVKQGQGTKILAPENWNLLDPLVLKTVISSDNTLAIFDDLIDVRAALESQMAQRTATKITDAQLDELHSQVMTLEGMLNDLDGYTEGDLHYHDTISRFSGHQLARSVLRSVQPLAMSSTYYSRTHRVPEDNIRSHRGHVAIYKQLAKRDPEGAARAVNAHILSSWEIYKSRARSSLT